MALLIRDIEYEKAKEVIDNLTDSERDTLIKYYISVHEKCYQEQVKINKSMREVFNGIRYFTSH